MEEGPGPSLIQFIKSLLRKKNHLSNLTEEIHELMDEGQAKGLISDEETDMVYGVLDLKETTAHSIMVPRTEISSAPLDATLEEIIQLVTDCGHTRIPIYKDSIDNIVGILHAKDILRLWGRPPESKLSPDLLRAPYFVPGHQKVSEILRELKEKQTHLAIVADEYGGTAGIITIEDILEEIVGEIMDEHDNNESLISPVDEHTVVVDARLEIEKLEEYLNLELPSGDFESVGGFIINLLGKIPEQGEQITYEALDMTIDSADERKIYKIRITRRRPSDSLEAEKRPRY